MTDTTTPSLSTRLDLLRDVPFDLRVEILENQMQKDPTESEKATIAQILKPHLRKQNQQGKRTDLLKKNTSSTLPDMSDKVTRNENVSEKIGRILGESGDNVRRREMVFKNADAKTKRSLDTGEIKLNTVYQKIVAAKNVKKPVPKLPAGKWNHIVEDPGWDWGNKNIGGSGSSGASHHYRTEPTDMIARIPVRTIAATNAVLYMWTTNQHLITGSMLSATYQQILSEQKLEVYSAKTTNPDKIQKMRQQVRTENEQLADILKKDKVQSDAISVMHCHGFTPKCIVTWEKQDKQGWGGYWLNNTTEHLLIGVRGDVPPFGLTEKTIIHSKYIPKSHSKKPEEMWRLIESCVTKTGWNNKKIELNCRTPRKGWQPHGDQITDKDMAGWSNV